MGLPVSRHTPANSALFLSLAFFFLFSVLNVAQAQFSSFGPSEIGTLVLYAAKLAFFFAFALLAYTALKNTSHAARDIPEPKAHRFYDPLLTLRFTAAMMVLLGHGFFVFFQPPGLRDTLRNGGWQWLLVTSPPSGLWMFYTLSGYLMGKGFFLQRYHPDWNGARRFYRNRLLKIVPMCWVAVIAASIVLYPEIFRPSNWGDLLRILFFDYDALQKINPIGLLFSLTTEMQFYAIVPLLYVVLGRRAMPPKQVFWIAAILFVFGIEYRLLGYRLWPLGVYRPLLANIDLFLCGFLANHVVATAMRRDIRLPHGLMSGFLLLLLLYFVASWLAMKGDVLNLPFWRPFYLVLFPAFVSAATAAIIVCFELGVQPKIPGFALRVAKKTEILGLLTYAIYIWHYPVYDLFARLRPASPATGRPVVESWPDAAQIVAMCCLVTLAISFALYRLVEIPFERRKTYDPK